MNDEPFLRAIIDNPDDDGPRLVLSLNPLGPAGGRTLAEWPGLSNLRVLNLDRCGLGDVGVAALVRSGRLRNLRELYLRGTNLSASVSIELHLGAAPLARIAQPG